MEKIKKNQKDIYLEFKEILKKESNEKNIFKSIEKIISKDNTNINIILKYLILKSKYDKNNFVFYLDKYSYFLPKKVLKSYFSEYNIKKISSFEMFELLYEKIEHYYKDMDINYRINFYNNLKTIPLDKEYINNYVSYENNPELYLNILYNETINWIKEKIINFKINHKITKNKLIQNLEIEINELKVAQKVKNYKINQNINNNFLEPNEEEFKLYNDFIKRNNNKDIDIDKKIKDLNNQLLLIYKISSDEFDIYFTKLSIFLKGIKFKFNNRFYNLEKSKNKEDFELFTFLCFFIGHFDFCELTQFYINLWDYSIKQDKEEINEILNENSYKNVNKYIIKDNILILEIYDNDNEKTSILKINNYSNYIIPNIIDYLSIRYLHLKKIEDKRIKKQNFFGILCNYFFDLICGGEIDKSNYIIDETTIDEYEIEKYLKINKYKNEIYIKKKWNVWKKFLINIFTSKTIKTAFNKFNKKFINNFELYDFLNENDLNSIFDNINFYQFPIYDICGITLSSPLLNIYQYYSGQIYSYGENISKLLSLCFNLIIYEREILSYFNLGVQNILLKKNIKFSNLYELNNLNEKNEELGEFIEELLYDKIISGLTYNQMLFILDEKNYTLSCDDFKQKFLEININFKPSQFLKNLFNSLDIYIDIIDNNLNFKYTIRQKISKNNNLTFIKNLQHVKGAFDYSPLIEKKQLKMKEKIKELSKKIKNKNEFPNLNNK